MQPNASYIFVTGGVVSSLGKGITAASLGRLLADRGKRISIMKLDPYLNVDPGTMSPYEHGEVFVTEDGNETDLDLGHYERFTGYASIGAANLTSGQIYGQVIERERAGDYLGKTVQVVPHVTNEIVRRMDLLAEVENADVVICEVGGTVGDIESLPFLEAIRQLKTRLPSGRCMFVHVTLVPHLDHSGEPKTKPTQHSLQELRRLGIQPDLLVCRASTVLDDEVREKIALFAALPLDRIISAPNVELLWEAPMNLAQQNVSGVIEQHLGLELSGLQMKSWNELVERTRLAAQGEDLRIALVGKYVQLEDAYLSVIEALRHACVEQSRRLEIVWVDSENLDDQSAAQQLKDVHGVLVPGGFGSRGVEGKVSAVRYARENKIPFLGICLGMQAAIVEYARSVVGMEGANSTEFDPDTDYPVVDLLPEQREAGPLGGSMRLGLQPVRIKPRTVGYSLYKEAVAYERHRHRYEVNPRLRIRLEQAGLRASGTTPDGRLVEIIELPRRKHPFFLATQFHPEFASRPLAPSPVFLGFVGAAAKRSV
jgi:CTP synthase